MIFAFIDDQRAAGHAVESICRVLREQGCQIAARTYRSWKQPGRTVAARTITDAQVIDAVREAAWTINAAGQRVLAPEGLYGRHKMTALIRRRLPQASAGSVDRAMRVLGLQGVRRVKKVRTTVPAIGGSRAADLLDRDFTAAAPNLVWITDFTYVRSWAGFVYVAFIVDVSAQRIVAWHAATTKVVDLVMTPLRMALWQRDHEGHPTVAGELIHHSDAGSQTGFNRWKQHPGSERVFDGAFRCVDGDVVGQAGDAVAGCAADSTRCVAGVLGSDRRGVEYRGGLGGVWCVGGGGVSAVPSGWRHAKCCLGATVGSVSVVC